MATAEAPRSARSAMWSIPLGTGRSSTRGLPREFGKNGRSRAICSAVSQTCSRIPAPPIRTVSHADHDAANTFVGPERGRRGATRARRAGARRGGLLEA